MIAPPPEQRYRSLFEQHPHVVFGLDLDGRLTEVNPAAGRISGYSRDQLVGMMFSDLLRPDDVAAAAAALDAVRGGDPQQLELSVIGPDGDTADLLITGIPWLVGDEVRGTYGIAEDVTERNRAARELETARHLAASASQARSDFVARMSHEIRTPLTSILATIELLADTLPADEHGLVATLQRSGARLLTLVDHVLDFASAEATSTQATEVFDLHDVVNDAVDLIRAQASAKGLQVVLDLADDVPRRVRDHPTWTSQILINLLTNAVDHTEHGGVRLTVTATTTASGLAVLYRVKDTGTGIDPAHHESIFEPFSRLPSSTRSTGRTGLGLSIVKQLVALGGGTIALNSAPGHGTTFFVSLPASLVDDEPT